MYEFERIVQRRVRDYWVRKGLCGLFAVIWMLLILRWNFRILGQEEDLLLFGERYASNLRRFLKGFLSTGLPWLGWSFLYAGIYAFSNSASEKIQGILLKECDPYLYEACVQRTERFLIFPDVYRLYIARAAYYQGDFQKAWNRIQAVRSENIRGKMMCEYYQIKALIYFEMYLEKEVIQIEEKFRSRAVGMIRKKQFRVCCARDNLRRAYDNEDFRMAYRFLREWAENMEKREAPYQKVFLTYWNGLIDVGAGNLAGGKEKLSQAAAEGNRLYFARRAGELLRGMDQQE